MVIAHRSQARIKACPEGGSRRQLSPRSSSHLWPKGRVRVYRTLLPYFFLLFIFTLKLCIFTILPYLLYYNAHRGPIDSDKEEGSACTGFLIPRSGFREYLHVLVRDKEKWFRLFVFRLFRRPDQNSLGPRIRVSVTHQFFFCIFSAQLQSDAWFVATRAHHAPRSGLHSGTSQGDQTDPDHYNYPWGF